MNTWVLLLSLLGPWGEGEGERAELVADRSILKLLYRLSFEMKH